MLRPNLKHTTSFFKESLNLFTSKRTFATINQKVCHYEVLGVKPNAALVEIKKAYYQKGTFILLIIKVHLLAKLFHPDTNKEENAEVKRSLTII